MRKLGLGIVLVVGIAFLVSACNDEPGHTLAEVEDKTFCHLQSKAALEKKQVENARALDIEYLKRHRFTDGQGFVLYIERIREFEQLNLQTRRYHPGLSAVHYSVELSPSDYSRLSAGETLRLLDANEFASYWRPVVRYGRPPYQGRAVHKGDGRHTSTKEFRYDKVGDILSGEIVFSPNAKEPDEQWQPQRVTFSCPLNRDVPNVGICLGQASEYCWITQIRWAHASSRITCSGGFGACWEKYGNVDEEFPFIKPREQASAKLGAQN